MALIAETTMAKRGRPRKLDEIKKREAVALFRAGFRHSMIANYIGCSLSTLMSELERDRDFGCDASRAELTYHQSNLENIHKAGEKSWRAAAWALSRRYPAVYSPTSELLSTEEAAYLGIMIVQRAMRVLPPEQREALRNEIYAEGKKCGELYQRAWHSKPSARGRQQVERMEELAMKEGANPMDPDGPDGMNQNNLHWDTNRAEADTSESRREQKEPFPGQ